MRGTFHRTLNRALSVVVLAAAAIGLSGCFDLTQSVNIGRDGSGHYAATATAKGFVGDALKNSSLVDPDRNHATENTVVANGSVTRSAAIDFKSLSELALSNETMSMAIKSRDFFGLGPAHVAFRTTVFVDRAKTSETAGMGPIGEAIAHSVLGEHVYEFSVTVPGSIEHIAPILLGNETFQPQVSGDFFHGNKIVWRLPLYKLVNAGKLDFEVDFSALGFFHDVKTQSASGGQAEL